ncbi:MAG: FGGY-family carbohydrate kinase [Treponema sp.]|jgi:sugar (pentulose or hexulose) kinase|nr:FGGY-family carbohydrate kinase [Treponema sp.]
MDVKQAIIENKTSLGIELGSTRIKAVLIDENFAPIAQSSHDWENRLEDGIWTYPLADVWTGLQDCFKNLALDVKERYGITLSSVGSIGISAMMHGYLVFDKNGEQLVPFRTWRNTTTEKASAILTERFKFNIPQRWSIAHLYQAVLNGEPHVKDIDFITTLAGYVHWKLTGKKTLGIGDASGMFPIDNGNYNTKMIKQFDELIASNNYSWKIANILPSILNAGENAGVLTAEGAKLLDSSDSLRDGIPLCPPEGDAGTGMVATNSVAERTGNVSAGTSIFAMIVMEKDLSKVYPEIDIVTTPSGKPVAMVHCNNCTSDIDAWIKLFGELLDISGAKMSKAALYDALYYKALEADVDCGGLLSFNYYSGETITGIDEGRPLFARLPDSNFSLANFMRTLLFSSMATLKYGIDILTEKEKAKIDSLLGHGGLFKTKGVGQRFMAAIFNAPVSVMESAGEGGAWGIALLASFMCAGKETLEKFLAEKVFAGKTGAMIEPDPKDVESFRKFMERYTAGLKIERVAVENLKRGDYES